MPFSFLLLCFLFFLGYSAASCASSFPSLPIPSSLLHLLLLFHHCRLYVRFWPPLFDRYRDTAPTAVVRLLRPCLHHYPSLSWFPSPSGRVSVWHVRSSLRLSGRFCSFVQLSGRSDHCMAILAIPSSAIESPLLWSLWPLLLLSGHSAHSSPTVQPLQLFFVVRSDCVRPIWPVHCSGACPTISVVVVVSIGPSSRRHHCFCLGRPSSDCQCPASPPSGCRRSRPYPTSLHSAIYSSGISGVVRLLRPLLSLFGRRSCHSPATPLSRCHLDFVSVSPALSSPPAASAAPATVRIFRSVSGPSSRSSAALVAPVRSPFGLSDRSNCCPVVSIFVVVWHEQPCLSGCIRPVHSVFFFRFFYPDHSIIVFMCFSLAPVCGFFASRRLV